MSASVPEALARRTLTVPSSAIALLLAAVAGAGCVLAPKRLDEERDELALAGEAFERPLGDRAVPELPENPTWRQLLERAFSVNGNLERSYFEWKAAVERVNAAAGYPNTNLAPSFSYLLSGSGMTAWDRTTLTIGFDPMQNLSLPSKVRKAAEIALEDARAVGQRFRASKFALQREVLDAWLDVALIDERIRIQTERRELARSAEVSAAERARTTGEQVELLRSTLERQETDLDLGDLEAQASSARARLNALLGRNASAELSTVQPLPDPRLLPADDEQLISAAVENNPELHALGSVVAARERALELARMQYLPDFNPFFSLTGSAERMIGVGVSLPTQLPRIRSGIEEARAMLRGAQAELAQASLDRTSAFVAALTMLRFSERAAAFLSEEVDPIAQQTAGGIAQSYSTGTVGFSDLLETQRVLVDLRWAIAEARIERERRLAELEEIAGMDFDGLQHERRESTESQNHE